MNSQQLRHILTSVPHVRAKFYGIFKQEHLPEYQINEETFIIVNTGLHWCVIYLPRDGNIEYFNPLGQTPTDRVKDFIRLQKRHYTFNPIIIQGPYSLACGCFCIFFVTLRLLTTNMTTIVNMFSNSFAINDNIVKRFVDSIPY